MSGDGQPKPPPPPEVLREIRAAVAARHYDDAQQMALQQLDAGAEHPQLLHLRSIWLEQRGRFNDALADLRRAHTLDPSELGVLMALGNLLERLNRHLEARQAFAQAAALRPELPGPGVRLGWASENLGDIDGARAAYEAALRIDPGNAEVLGRLALIASQQGDWDEARERAGRALQVNPAEFNASLAYIRADLRDGRLDEAARRLDEVLARNLPPDHAYLAHKELGALADKRGDPGAAFAAWAKGAGIAHRHYARLYPASGGAAAMTARLRNHFAAQEPWGERPPAEGPARQHVFLLGFGRSGTTLLEQVLAAHPDVVSLEEKETLRGAVEAFEVTDEGLSALRDADEAALAPLRAAYWREVAGYGAEVTGKVFIDKSPFNAIRLAHIARLFPGARVLFAIRDPRDVVLSCFRTPFRVNGIVYELLRIEDAGRYYAAYMDAAAQMRRVTGATCLELRHEDLLDRFEEEVRRVCEFIGIDFRPGMLAFETAERKVATPSAHQLRGGLTRAHAGQWRRYAEQLAPALPHLQPWAERFGYPPK